MFETARDDVWFEDVCIIILRYLSVRDILRFAQTSRRNAQIASAKVLWVYILEREITAHHIPFPAHSRPIAQLSGGQTKSLLTHVLRLHRSTTCNVSQSAAKVFLNQSLPVTWVQIVNGTWLLAAMSNENISTLMLFSIEDITEEQNAKPMAQCFLDGPVANGLVEISGDNTIIALDLRSQTPSIDVLTLQMRSDKIFFVRIARHPGLSHIRALRGPFIGFALHYELNLSVPSILNWKTGKILRLQQMPDMNGSAMAMAIHKSFAAVVTPRELHLFTAEMNDLDSAVSRQVAQISLPGTISFAQVCFVEDSPGGCSRPSIFLRVCISSIQGIRLFSAPLHQLLRHPSMGELLWSLTSSVPGSRRVKWNEYQLNPLFGKSLETVSWLESYYGTGSAEDLPPMRFATLTARLSLAEGEDYSEIPIYRLADIDGPAMYAMCTRDYDDGLGLLALGNIFGELALYQLAGVNLGETSGCLERPALSSYDGSDMLSLVPIISCPSPPFPLDGTLREPRDDEMKALDEKTRRQRPTEVPRRWSTDFLEYSNAFQSRIIGAFMGYGEDLAWQCEHLYHYLGHPIPLMHGDDTVIFFYGGLHFVYVSDVGKIYLIRPGPSIYEFADTLVWESHIMPVKELSSSNDDIGLTYYAQIQVYWLWEVHLHKRDRWKELETRGGTVADYWSTVDMDCTVLGM